MELVKWKFPRADLKGLDKDPLDDAVFYITRRAFRDDLYSQYMSEQGLEDFENWVAQKFTSHIRKIEYPDGRIVDDADAISKILLEMEPTRGYMLELAIMRRNGYLEKGLVKN